MINRQSLWLLAMVLLVSTPPAVAQTCRDDINASTPDSRFIDNGDGTVNDQATGLIWKQCAEGLSGTGCQIGSAMRFTWQQALQQAESADFAGSALWRLPNKKELGSLVEQRCYAPAINAHFFPNTPTTWWFWSSSTYAYNSSYAWEVDFNDGEESYGYKLTANEYVRLVRDRQ